MSREFVPLRICSRSPFHCVLQLVISALSLGTGIKHFIGIKHFLRIRCYAVTCLRFAICPLPFTSVSVCYTTANCSENI